MKETLAIFQREVAEWSKYNFGARSPYLSLLGISAESGRVAYVYMREEQGTNGDPCRLRAREISSIGNIIIYLADYCDRRGLNLAEAVADTWEAVRNHDWKTDPDMRGDKCMVYRHCWKGGTKEKARGGGADPVYRWTCQVCGVTGVTTEPCPPRYLEEAGLIEPCARKRDLAEQIGRPPESAAPETLRTDLR